VVIGEFRFPQRDRMVFAVRSADRAIEGAKFFKANLVRPYSVDGRTMRFADNP
jgi:hypothetical protein